MNDTEFENALKNVVRVEEWRYLHAAALHETGREEIQ
jgi:hypothetical protein